MRVFPCAVILLVALAASASAGNWPAWRGPDGNGQTSERDLPLTWSTTENVRWKIPLPADGNSTPALWGDRIFLTQATERGKVRTLHCLDRSDGKELWKRETRYDAPEMTHGTNPYCSASPLTDGEHVVVSHGSAGMFCYDFSGKELWKKDLGKLEHIWGNASSPIFYKDLVILWCGPGERQFLLAVDKKTGKTVWEHQEASGHAGHAAPIKDANPYATIVLQSQRLAGAASTAFALRANRNVVWKGSWSTPIVARIAYHDELILSVPNKVKGFDPASGKELWSCDGLTDLVYTSPVCSPDGIVVAFSGYGGAALAVRAGGKGDVTATHRLWHHRPGNPQRIGSALIKGDHAYLYNESGLMQCFDLKTGKDLWNRERVGGTSWSSPVLAGNRAYLLTQDGDTLVIELGDKPKVLATNKLNEMTRASIVVSDGELFIRTYKHLWCIRGKQKTS